MRKSVLGVATLSLLLFSPAVGSTPARGAPPSGEEIVIQVSPQTILLNWKAQGDVRVTVHAEVSFSLFVEGSVSVSLDGIQAVAIFADARGDLVAKFPFEEVAGLVDVGTATLTLTAIDKNGVTYTGSDDVRVIAP